MKKTLSFLVCVGLVFSVMGWVGQAYAAPITPPSGGGTGIGTTISGNNGLCLTQSSSNPFAYTFATCGSGGGGSSTLIYAGSYIGVSASGTNGYIITNNGVTSTAGLLTIASGSATYYPLTNPSGYVNSSTGLSYFFPATTTIFLSSTKIGRAHV